MALESCVPSKQCLSLAEYIEKERNPKKNDTLKKNHNETNVLFVGEMDSGKTSLLNVLLGRKEKSRPTITPSFDFAVKDDMKANIWEMGQVVHKDIASIPINMSQPPYDNVVVVIVLDLSKPENVIPSLTQWITFLGSTFERHKKTLLNQSAERKNTNGNAIFEKLPFQVLIVANKYDKFKNEESMKRKVICSALRYFAYVSNTHLVFASTKDKVARDNYKKVSRQIIFSRNDNEHKVKAVKQNVDESNGPLLIFNDYKSEDEKKDRHLDSLREITKSLPSNILHSTKYANELFSSHLTKDVVAAWVSMSESIFGPDSVDLTFGKKGQQMREKLKESSNEKIDVLIKEADEEIRRLGREQSIRFELPQTDYLDEE